LEEDKNDELLKTMASSYTDVIKDIGENPSREGLLKTPQRAAKAMQFLTNGYDLNPDDLINQAIFHEEYSEMVIVKDIEVYSLCEHHILPFFGKAHVAYIQSHG
jgi:GTP cyclohydrolase I